MTRTINEQPGEPDLQEVIEKLCSESYAKLRQLCVNANKQADKLNSLESQDKASQYTALCNDLIKEINDCLQVRQEVFIPYIRTLIAKIAEHHNCSNCTGSCKVNHDMQLIELQVSHKNIKNILCRLQMVSLPLYSETIYPDAYRILRNQMALVENVLTELFSLEEQHLIPKVVNAQTTINAGS